MERGPEGRFEALLKAEIAVPDDAFEEGIDEADDDGGRHGLRPEPGALRDAARNDRRYGGRESEQEEELHKRGPLRCEARAFSSLVAVQHRGAEEEADAIGDRVA